MGGVFLDAPEAGDVLAPIPTKIANAKAICSTVPEIAGNRDIAGITEPQQLSRCRFRHCPRILVVADRFEDDGDLLGGRKHEVY